MRGSAAAIRVLLSCLLVACLASPAAAFPAGQRPRENEPLPFELNDLRRRAAALSRAAENLLTLLEARREGRLDDGRFKDYFVERTELLKDLAKDIERDPSVRQIDKMKRLSKAPKLENPEKPESLDDTRPLLEQLADDARQLRAQIDSISEDYSQPEVSVRELARPSPAALCRRIRKAADHLADFAKSL